MQRASLAPSPPPRFFLARLAQVRLGWGSKEGGREGAHFAPSASCARAPSREARRTSFASGPEGGGRRTVAAESGKFGPKWTRSFARWLFPAAVAAAAAAAKSPARRIHDTLRQAEIGKKPPSAALGKSPAFYPPP